MGKKNPYVKQMEAVTAVFTNSNFVKKLEQPRELTSSEWMPKFIIDELRKREISANEKPRKSSAAPRARAQRRRP